MWKCWKIVGCSNFLINNYSKVLCGLERAEEAGVTSSKMAAGKGSSGPPHMGRQKFSLN